MNDDQKKHYAVVPEKVNVPETEPLLPTTRSAPPTAHPELGTSVPDELPPRP